MKKKLIIIIIILTSFCGCKKVWTHFVDSFFSIGEDNYRLTFYSCPFGGDKTPRIPVVYPLEMTKSNITNTWWINTSVLQQEDINDGDYNPVELIFGDKHGFYFYTNEHTSYFPDGTLYVFPQHWCYINLDNDLIHISEYSNKKLFIDSVGNEVFEQMRSPDYYHSLFIDDEKSLPWITAVEDMQSAKQ